jgi:hypothetical protein
MNVYGGVDVWTHVFFTSALVGGEWSASHPCRIILGERAAGTHQIRVRMESKSGLDNPEKRKFLTLPGLELVQSVGSR